jgi:hypothetical protein
MSKTKWNCGFAIGVELDQEYEETLPEEGVDLSEPCAQVERNLMDWLRKELALGGSDLQDEGHGGNDLVGTIWLSSAQVQKVFDEWEFCSDSRYALTSSSGAIPEEAFDKDVEVDAKYGGKDAFISGLNVSIELFDLPSEEDLEE